MTAAPSTPFGRAVAVLCAADAATAVLWFYEAVPIWALASALIVVAVALAAWMRRTPVQAAVLVGATLTLGPMAGPVLALTALPGGKVGARDALRAEAAAETTAADRVLAQVAAGRRFRPRAASPVPMVEVFDAGGLRDQQVALSALARQFGPELRPALDRALASDIPAIRVQAAAVFAVLRDRYADRARRLNDGTSGLTGPALADEVATLAASGFVDPADLPDVPPAQPDAAPAADVADTDLARPLRAAGASWVRAAAGAA